MTPPRYLTPVKRLHVAPAVLIALVAPALTVGCVTNTRRSGLTPASSSRDDPDPPASARPEAPLSHDPVILPGRGKKDAKGGVVPLENADTDSKKRRKVDETDDAFREKLAAAREAVDAGEDEAALTLVAAALDMNPKPPWDQRFKSLRSEIKARHVGTDVLRIDVRPLRDYVVFGQDVDLLIRIKNVGADVVTVRPPDRAGPGALSSATLVLTIKRTDLDIYAAELSRSWMQTVPLLDSSSPELRIPPDGIHEIRVRVPGDEIGDAISGMKVLDLSGELRAGGILAGIEEPFGRVPIRPGRVVALPANYEPVAADPLGSLSRAVDALAPVHVLVATEFLSPDDRPAAVGVLARSLWSSPVEMRPAALHALDLIRRSAAGTPVRPLAAPLMDALTAHPERSSDLMEALHVMTRVTNPPDERLWADWWRREQAGPGAKVALEDAGPVRTISAPGPTDAKPTFSDPNAKIPPPSPPAPVR